METRRFGNTELRVSVLGFGAAEIGFENTADRVLDRIIGVALDAGINVVDTAAMYADSEEKLGRALNGRRDRFHVFTKCGRFSPRLGRLFERAYRKAYRSLGRADRDDFFIWHPLLLKWNIDESLRRLKIDRVDLIQLHSCPEDVLRRGDAIEALKRAQQAGKVRYIGYSGDGPAALYAIKCRQFDALQTSVSIADQSAIEETLPIAREYGIGVIAKRPIANGLWKSQKRPDDLHHQAYWDRLRELGYDFLRDERAFPTALRFTLNVDGVHTAIVGTTNPENFEQNIKTVAARIAAKSEFDAIRAQWKKVARPNWVAQM